MIEIRVITYKRPKLLERALLSLIAQTYADWRAVVLDDSTGFESQIVIEGLGDSRIETRCNLQNLGMVLNLSQAFSSEAFFQNSTHACILEDDNALDSEWLEKNLQAMSSHPCRVMTRNYRVVDVGSNGDIHPTSHLPMRDLYGDTSRYLTYEDRIREAFFNFTVGTSCYFWDLRSGVDLSIKQETVHGQLIENIRGTCFRDSCWYESEPLSTFSRFVDKSQTPRGETPGNARRRRIAKISEIQFTRHLMRTWTAELGRTVREIISDAEHRKDGPEAIQHLAEAGYLPAFFRLRNKRSKLAAVKAWLVGALYWRAWRQINQPVPIPPALPIGSHPIVK
ncbi:MAG: glycosyltransferase family A protein [Prosthecobacter sp.]